MLAASAVEGTTPPPGPEWRRGALPFERRPTLGDDCSGEAALELVSERDVLASVALVLFAAGKGAGLMLASDIDDIDHLALSRAAFVLPAANDFLDRVRDGDPDAWWGALH